MPDPESIKPQTMECPFQKKFPSQLNRDDFFFITLAYNQAIEAWKLDEVPVGAVICVDGQIIASAHNSVESSNDPTAHAEMIAITQAARALDNWRLSEATLYVTKEPCPMCSGALIMSRLKRVVYAIGDPKMGCSGGATNLNELPQTNHRVEITTGVMEEECRQIIQAFFQRKR
ncbi:MAG: nucleoside deaminase [Opitutaceae bacterium]|nr:nucleoside deaminase [Opitutaceae bacterium]